MDRLEEESQDTGFLSPVSSGEIMAADTLKTSLESLVGYVADPVHDSPTIAAYAILLPEGASYDDARQLEDSLAFVEVEGREALNLKLSAFVGEGGETPRLVVASYALPEEQTMAYAQQLYDAIVAELAGKDVLGVLVDQRGYSEFMPGASGGPLEQLEERLDTPDYQ